MPIGMPAAKTCMSEAQAAPKQQRPQAAQLSKSKKIEWFAGHLVNEAILKERAGRTGDAFPRGWLAAG